jgi:ElaB/YqjD/DUF883 family membrane-anchored ribosome-binding protein
MATTSSTATRSTGSGDDSNDSMTAVQKLREQADAVVERIQPQIAAVSTYVRDEPTKALLISAAAGAAVMGLIALVVRSGSRSPAAQTASAGRSAMAAIRDAALDLAESAQSMAADALEAAQQRVSDALGSTQKRVAAARDSVQERVAAARDSAQERAAAARDRAQKRAEEGADSVTEAAADAWKKVRDQAAPLVDKIRPQIDAAAAYAKDDPVRAAIGLAAAGAIIAGLIALTRRSDEDDSLS